LGFAYAQGADGLVAQLQGQDRPAFLIAGSTLGDSGGWHATHAAIALRHRVGAWGLTVAAQNGEAWVDAPARHAAALRGQGEPGKVAQIGLSLDRRLGDVEGALGLTWMGEEAGLLGAQFQPGLGLAGADSLFADISLGWQMAPGWRLGGSFRQGFTSARQSLVVAGGSQLVTRGFALDVERRGLFQADDALAFRLSQPLRVESGRLALALPTAWDYATLSATRQVQWLNLAPSGRELDAELAWRGKLAGGWTSASLFWRRDPGHIANAPDDTGVALRWSRGF